MEVFISGRKTRSFYLFSIYINFSSNLQFSWILFLTFLGFLKLLNLRKKFEMLHLYLLFILDNFQINIFWPQLCLKAMTSETMFVFVIKIQYLVFKIDIQKKIKLIILVFSLYSIINLAHKCQSVKEYFLVLIINGVEIFIFPHRKNKYSFRDILNISLSF